MRRRVVVHRWPAVPTAPNKIARTARFKSAVRATHLLGDFNRGNGAKRREARGFPHSRIAAHDCERGVPRPYRYREIEGGDDANGPERMPLLHHAMVRALRRHGQPVK